MAYWYNDGFSKAGEECVFISSASRSSGNISNFTSELNETIIGALRIDLLSFSYQRIPNIPFIAIKLSQIGNTCNSNNYSFIINNNCNVQNLDGIDIVSRCDLFNTYALFSGSKFENLTQLTLSFYNPITGATINMLSESHWVFRIRYVKDNWTNNV